MQNSIFFDEEEFSIYVHWPYCLSLCPYCDFNSHILDKSSINAQEWSKAYVSELHHFLYKFKNKKIRSIFVGGGTPSLMPVSIIYDIINFIQSHAIIDNNTEITLEANPTSYEAQKFKSFREAGINRVSIGVQSFDDKELKLLGREHSALEAKKTICSANNIFDQVSFDLIYALPQQTLQQWQRNLQEAANFQTKHLSLYQLTIEKGTQFFTQHRQGKLEMLSDETAKDMFEFTDNYLNDCGYKRYEISNHAISSYECKHNINYWKYNEYLGIGPGAHSRLRDQNNYMSVVMLHKPMDWFNKVLDTGVGIQKTQILSFEEKIIELFFTGTRLIDGINSKQVETLLKTSFDDIIDINAVNNFCKMGLMRYDNSVLKLTNDGFVLHTYLVNKILNNILLNI